MAQQNMGGIRIQRQIDYVMSKDKRKEEEEMDNSLNQLEKDITQGTSLDRKKQDGSIDHVESESDQLGAGRDGGEAAARYSNQACGGQHGDLL